MGRRGSTIPGPLQLIFLVVGTILCVAQMIVEAIKLLLAYVLHVVEDAIEASANLFSDPIFWLVLCMGLVIVVAVCLDVILSRVERRSNATVSQTIDSPEYSAQEDSQTSVKEAQEPQKDWPPNLILPSTLVQLFTDETNLDFTNWSQYNTPPKRPVQPAPPVKHFIVDEDGFLVTESEVTDIVTHRD